MNATAAFAGGIILGAIAGAAVAWIWARVAVHHAQLYYAERLNAELDRVAVVHSLQLEAVQRGTDTGAADLNALQILLAMRANLPPSKRMLQLDRVRTVRPPQAASG